MDSQSPDNQPQQQRSVLDQLVRGFVIAVVVVFILGFVIDVALRQLGRKEAAQTWPSFQEQHQKNATDGDPR